MFNCVSKQVTVFSSCWAGSLQYLSRKFCSIILLYFSLEEENNLKCELCTGFRAEKNNAVGREFCVEECVCMLNEGENVRGCFAMTLVTSVSCVCFVFKSFIFHSVS